MKTYKQLAQQFNKSESTISHYVKKFNLTKHRGPDKLILIDDAGEKVLTNHCGPKKKKTIPLHIRMELRPEAY